MKKSLKGALICLFMAALLGLAGVASAATTSGIYTGQDAVLDDATGNTGSVSFTVNKSTFTGVMLAPDVVNGIPDAGNQFTLTGKVGSDGSIKASSVKVNGVKVTSFTGILGDADDDGLFTGAAGTYVLSDGNTGTWTAAQLSPKGNAIGPASKNATVAGGFTGTFAVKAAAGTVSTAKRQGTLGFIVFRTDQTTDPTAPDGTTNGSIMTTAGDAIQFTGGLATTIFWNPATAEAEFYFASPAKFSMVGLDADGNAFKIAGTISTAKSFSGYIYAQALDATGAPAVDGDGNPVYAKTPVGTWKAARH